MKLKILCFDQNSFPKIMQGSRVDKFANMSYLSNHKDHIRLCLPYCGMNAPSSEKTLC